MHWRKIRAGVSGAAVSAVLCATATWGAAAAEPATIEFLGRYESGVSGGAEIAAYDRGSQRLFVTNGETGEVDVLDVSSPAAPARVASIVVDGEPTHVAVANGLLAISVNKDDGESPGEVAFFNAYGEPQFSEEVGFLPDMVTFARNGRVAVVANEGEPTDAGDPQGSISVINVVSRSRRRTPNVCTADFSGFSAASLDASTRLFPGKTPEFDFEPEYIAAPRFGRKAFAILQEANAIATVDLRRCKVTAVNGLGFKDHSLEGAGIDPSDRDGAIAIATQPVKGIYMPDNGVAFRNKGEIFIATANEGDARDEDERIEDVTLDPTAFPNAAFLQQEENLGRLEISTIDGDTDGDGDFDELFAYGARSFSVYDAYGRQVYDSGDDFERITAALIPANFNANDDDASFDSRSDAKGPEPEGIAVGRVRRQRLAFIGLERVGGVMVYDISDPYSPAFCSYVNTRDFSGPDVNTSTDQAPEGIVFVSSAESPTRDPLLFVSNEVSGTVASFRVRSGACGE
ncbi:MAG: choice-of-anchor I family protein [Pseudomonadota bacterium]